MSAATIPQRPTAIPVRPGNIPDVLTARRQWVLWKYEWRKDKAGKGKWTKPPFQMSGRNASSTDPETWATFEQVVSTYRDGKRGWDGIGYVPVPDEELTAGDADHCRDPESGSVTGPDGRALLELDTYTEVSPSGTGLRAFAFGRKPGRDCKKGDFELYDGLTREGGPNGRYLTVTGHRLKDVPATINSRQAEIERIYFRYWPKPEPKPSGGATAPAALGDDEILQRAFASAKSGANIRSLYGGDFASYPSQSEADQALCNHLAFWFRKDAAAIDRAFRASGLFREDKWDRKGYREGTITKAITSVAGEGYDPDHRAAKLAVQPAAPPARVTELSFGEVTLRPERARRTAGGKVVLPVVVVKGGRPLDQITVTSSADGRRAAVKLLSAHLGGEDAASDAMSQLLSRALEELMAPPDATGATVAAIVRNLVPNALGLAYRTDRGLWSESLGREIGRGEFTAYTPTALVDAAAAVTEAPDRVSLVRAVAAELGILWCDLQQSLPRSDGAALGCASAAGQKFREALIRLWTATKTFEVAKQQNESVASRSSLISRVRGRAFDRQGVIVMPDGRPKWEPVQRAFDAWYRPAVIDGGECIVLLAMRWTLGAQIGVELPGVTCQAGLTAVGEQYGLLATPKGVSDRLSDGSRLSVLSVGVSAELLGQPDEDAEDSPTDTNDSRDVSVNDFYSGEGCH